jgi:hypothetical protein
VLVPDLRVRGPTSHIRLNHKVYEKFFKPVLVPTAAKPKSSLKQPTWLEKKHSQWDSPTRQQWIDDHILCFAKDLSLCRPSRRHFIT